MITTIKENFKGVEWEEALELEINEDQGMRTSKDYSKLARGRESATLTCILADSKAGRRVGKLYISKMGRLQVCPRWRGNRTG